MNSEYVTNCELHKAEQESQVRYWIINDEGERVSVEEQCKHESNGKFYGAMEWGAPGKLKCKKCGEIYE
jgi:transcription initiation factor IIE alpha subunit